MTIRNLDQLLAPTSVTLIGASRKEGSVGLITARNLLRGAFTGPIWLVNPKYRDIEGHPCHPSIAALPGAPQLALVATPPQTVPGIIGELGTRGRAPPW
jgi:acetyltransferase